MSTVLFDVFARLARFRPAARGLLRIGGLNGDEIAALRRFPPERSLIFTAHSPTAERLRPLLADLPRCEVDPTAVSGRSGPLWFGCDPISGDPRAVLDGAPPVGADTLFKTSGRFLAARLLELGLPAAAFDLLWIGDGMDVVDLLTGAVDGVAPSLNVVLTPADFDAPRRLDAAMFDQGFVRLKRGDPREPWAYVRSALVENWAQLADGGCGRATMSNLGNNGRFANQLFQYAHIKMYGLRRGATVHAPEWVGDDLFGCADPRDVDGLTKLPLGAFDMEGYALWSDPDPPTNVDFQGYYQILPHSWRVHHRNLLRRLFTPLPAVAAPLDAWLASVRPPGGELVGLHVRRGDYVALGQHVPWFTPVPTELYRDWLADVWPTLRNPALFIATDAPDEILPLFADYRPVAAVDAPCSVAAAGFYPDFYALSRCDLLAMCNSSFSRMAGLLAPAQRCWLANPARNCFDPYDPWADDAFWDNFRTLDDGYRAYSRATAARYVPPRLNPPPPPAAAEAAAVAEWTAARNFLRMGARVVDTADDAAWGRRLADERPEIVVLRAVGLRERLDALRDGHGVDHVDLLRAVVGQDEWPAAARLLDGATRLLETGRIAMVQIAYAAAAPELADVCGRLRLAGYRLYLAGSERLGAFPAWRPELADGMPGVLLAIAERLAAAIIGQGRPTLDVDSLRRACGAAAEAVLHVGDGLAAALRAPADLDRAQAVIARVHFQAPPEGGLLIEAADAALAARGFRRAACASPDGPAWGDAFYHRTAPPPLGETEPDETEPPPGEREPPPV